MTSIFYRLVTAAMILITAVLLCTSCSDDNEFVIRGEIKELGHQPVEISYYAGGGIKIQEETANNGKFEFHAVSTNPTLVALSRPGNAPIAYMVVKNGDEINVKGESGDPYLLSVKGNRPSADLAKFMTDNAVALRNGDKAAVNLAVADYIRANPSSPASGALLVTRFYSPGYEELADSLLRQLEPGARPAAVMQNFGTMLGGQVSSDSRTPLQSVSLYAGGDTLARLIPSRQSCALVTFTGSDRDQRDSVTSWLRLFADSLPRRRFKILDVSLAADSAAWGNSIKGDSARWSHAWAPGGTASPQIRKLNIPLAPYFIVIDSTGTQLYRGSSITRASDVVRERLNVTRLRP